MWTFVGIMPHWWDAPSLHKQDICTSVWEAGELWLDGVLCELVERYLPRLSQLQFSILCLFLQLLSRSVSRCLCFLLVQTHRAHSLVSILGFWDVQPEVKSQKNIYDAPSVILNWANWTCLKNELLLAMLNCPHYCFVTVIFQPLFHLLLPAAKLSYVLM